MVNRPNIELDIAELVLHGFPAHDAHLIRDAIEMELIRLLQERGLSHLSGEINLPRISAGTIHLANGLNAGMIGFNIADNVYRGLSQIHENSSRQDGLSSITTNTPNHQH